jgi:septum formation protein
MTAIVLASQSLARRRLLASAGIEAVIDPAGIDEGRIKQDHKARRGTADDCAAALALVKAETVAARHPDALVIGADQILDCGGTWFDKPRDSQDARAQLRALRGRGHDLVSAIVLLRDRTTRWRHVERAHLIMRNFSDSFLEGYAAAMGNELCQSVGAYALEGLGSQLFSKVEGDYFAILGLPLLPLLDRLRAEGALAP